MRTYVVFYASMTAIYGPAYIEANSEEEAKRKFDRGAFSANERVLIHARELRPGETASVQTAD